jgi:hypothetical protein
MVAEMPEVEIMEDTELGCHHRSECKNYLEKCKDCSAHYTSEFEGVYG